MLLTTRGLANFNRMYVIPAVGCGGPNGVMTLPCEHISRLTALGHATKSTFNLILGNFQQ